MGLLKMSFSSPVQLTFYFMFNENVLVICPSLNIIVARPSQAGSQGRPQAEARMYVQKKFLTKFLWSHLAQPLF